MSSGLFAASGRPSIGLALSGGGARGAAHIGVLKVLEELRVPVDCVVGTSMGAIVGGLYAAGLSPEELERALVGIHWADTFEDQSPRAERTFVSKQDDRVYLVKARAGLKNGQLAFPKGVVQGQKLEMILSRLTQSAARIQSFDQLPIPFRAVATDIASGQPVILEKGSLGQALRASLSIPAALAPVKIDDHLLVDGGVSNNLPIDVTRTLCADLVIAVSIGTPLKKAEALNSLFDITGQLTTVMTQQNTQRQLAGLTSRDLLIEPDLGDIATADFEKSVQAIALGAAEARTHAPALSRLALDPAAYQNYRLTHRLPSLLPLPVDRQGESLPSPPSAPRPIIHFIRIDTNAPMSEATIRARLTLQLGDPFEVAQVEADMARIYGLSDFQRVSYQLVEEQGQTGLLIQAIVKEWGPHYLQAGLNLESNFKGKAAFNVAARYLMTGLNQAGGEWRMAVQTGQDNALLTDFYQPLDYARRYFFDPTLVLADYNADFYDHQDALNAYRVRRVLAGLEGGANLASWGELRAGIRRGVGTAHLRAGNDPINQGRHTLDEGYVFLHLTEDTLDNLNFPHAGRFNSWEYLDSLTTLGADQSFQAVRWQANVPFVWGPHTWIAGLDLAGKVSGGIPLASQFTLGGFTKLSGYQERELIGQYMGLVRWVYFYRLNQASQAFSVPMYAGASLEAGNVWDTSHAIGSGSLRKAGSLFLGIDSPLGPLYLANGVAQGGHQSLYFFLGKAF